MKKIYKIKWFRYFSVNLHQQTISMTKSGSRKVQHSLVEDAFQHGCHLLLFFPSWPQWALIFSSGISVSLFLMGFSCLHLLTGYEVILLPGVIWLYCHRAQWEIATLQAIVSKFLWGNWVVVVPEVFHNFQCSWQE